MVFRLIYSFKVHLFFSIVIYLLILMSVIKEGRVVLMYIVFIIPLRISNQLTIGKTHPTLFKNIAVMNYFQFCVFHAECSFCRGFSLIRNLPKSIMKRLMITLTNTTTPTQNPTLFQVNSIYLLITNETNCIYIY